MSRYGWRGLGPVCIFVGTHSSGYMNIHTHVCGRVASVCMQVLPALLVFLHM